MTLITSRPVQPAAAKGAVIEVDERNFQQEVLERSRKVPVVVDFWAPWCGPCRTLGPILEKLATEAKGAWVLAKVNVDNNPNLSQAFGVQGIPAVKAVRDGQLIDEFTGALPESQVRTWLKRFVPASAEQAAEDLRALETSNPAVAEQRYRQLLEQDPKRDDVRVALGRVLFATANPESIEWLQSIALGSPAYQEAQAWLTLDEYRNSIGEEDAFDLLHQVDQNPGNLEARYQLAAHHVQGGSYEQAIEQLLAIVGRNRSFRDDAARKIMLAIFIALGNQSPISTAGRKQLANLLF
jgi:putative thioredoxin